MGKCLMGTICNKDSSKIKGKLQYLRLPIRFLHFLYHIVPFWYISNVFKTFADFFGKMVFHGDNRTTFGIISLQLTMPYSLLTSLWIDYIYSEYGPTVKINWILGITNHFLKSWSIFQIWSVFVSLFWHLRIYTDKKLN